MTDLNKITPQKILLLRTDRIGDMLCTTPAIRAIRKTFPDATIDLVASDKNSIAVLDNPDIDNLFVLPLKKYWLWPVIALKLRFKKYDLVVGFNSRSRTASRLVKFINGKISVGNKRDKTSKYYDKLFEIKNIPHIIDAQLEIARRLGADDLNQDMIFTVSEDSRLKISEKFPRKEGVKRIAIFIGNAKKVDTRWHEDNFLELNDRLSKHDNVEIYMVAGPGDSCLLKGFSWNDRTMLFPQGSFQELGAFMETCDIFITSSSGPMHLAAAVKAPMLAILAERTYLCWRPLSNIHTIINSGLPGVHVKSVTVSEVYAKAIEKLGLKPLS
jgi:ADP-heptose:LPS heptosyltransferase